MATKILLPAILSRYSPRADKSWAVTLVLNEPNKDQKEIIDALHQQAVYVMLKDTGISKEDENIMDLIDGDIEVKTPSQRLRGVLFRNWEQNAKGYKEFKDYYKSEMERIITHFKDKLD